MAQPDTLSGECLDAPDVGRYEFIWQSGPTTVTKNKNGITGYAKLLKSSNANNPAGTICRIHLCGYNPCLVKWPDAKYGTLGPPMHLQPIAETLSTAVAETLSTAVAETTAVVETLSTAVAEKASEKEATPDCPMQEELPNLKPPAPAPAIDLCIEDDAMHVDVHSVAPATPSVASVAVEPQQKIVKLCWLWRARSDSPGLM